VLLNTPGFRLELFQVLFQVSDNLLAAVKMPLAVTVAMTAATLVMTAFPAVRMMAVMSSLLIVVMSFAATAAPVFEMHLASSRISNC
jgi:hypothetical protein